MESGMTPSALQRFPIVDYRNIDEKKNKNGLTPTTTTTAAGESTTSSDNTVMIKSGTVSTSAKFKEIASLRPTTTTKSKPNIFKSSAIMNVDYIPTNSQLHTLKPYDYAMYLYNKYVKDGSDLQINIPSKTRKALNKFLIKTNRSEVELLDDYTDKMFKLYDKAWEQIHKLIDKDSYSRFRDTKEYETIWLKCKQEDEERVANGNGDGLLTPNCNPQLLDWESNEMVVIMEEQDHDIDDNDDDDEDDEMAEDFKKLSSIKDLNSTRSTETVEDENEAIDTLAQIVDCDSNQKKQKAQQTQDVVNPSHHDNDDGNGDRESKSSADDKSEETEATQLMHD